MDSYQHNFSDSEESMFDESVRVQKANKTLAVLKDFLQDFHNLKLLNIGSSTGIMTNEYSKYFVVVIGIDLDAKQLSMQMKILKKKI